MIMKVMKPKSKGKQRRKRQQKIGIAMAFIGTEEQLTKLKEKIGVRTNDEVEVHQLLVLPVDLFDEAEKKSLLSAVRAQLAPEVLDFARDFFQDETIELTLGDSVIKLIESAENKLHMHKNMGLFTAVVVEINKNRNPWYQPIDATLVTGKSLRGKNEKPQEVLRREVMEELEVDVAPLLLFGNNSVATQSTIGKRKVPVFHYTLVLPESFSF